MRFPIPIPLNYSEAATNPSYCVYPRLEASRSIHLSRTRIDEPRTKRSGISVNSESEREAEEGKILRLHVVSGFPVTIPTH